MAILPPTELMLTTRPLLRIRAGRSVWVTAMWSKRLTSNRRRHSSIAKASTGALTATAALFTSARTARPCGSPCNRVASARMWSGLVMSMISGSIPGPRIASASRSRRTPARTWNPRRASSRAVAAPMPLDAPVITAISWISGDAVTTAFLLRRARSEARCEELRPLLEHLHRGLVREQPVQCEEEDLGARLVAQDGGDAFVRDLAVERLTLGVDPLTGLEELASHGRADHLGPGFEHQQTAHAEQALVGAATPLRRPLRGRVT